MDAQSYRDALDKVTSLAHKRIFGEALQIVDDLLRENPRSSELLVRRATLQQLDDAEHSLDSIEGDLRTAQLLSPENFVAQLEIGHFLYAVRDRPGDALQSFQSARRIAADALKEAMIGEIKCHADLHAWDMAADVLAEAEAHFPNDLDLSLLRAEHEPYARRDPLID